MKIRSIVAGACALVAGVAAAEYTPVMVSLVTPVQAPSRSYDVGGVRLSLIYGDCHDFTGLDIGVAQRTAGEFTGVGVGGVNIANEFTGLDLGGVNIANEFTGVVLGGVNIASEFTGVALGGVNVARGCFRGGQLGLVNQSSSVRNEWGNRSTGLQLGFLNRAGSFCGLQDGILINISTEKFDGWQSAIVNYSHDIDGLQSGFYFIWGVNIASGTVRGCQIGLVNFAKTMESGLQLGLVNVIAKNGWLPALPFINGGF